MADPVNPQQMRLLQESITVQQEFIRVLKDDLAYRQKLEERARVQPEFTVQRAWETQVRRALEDANAVPTASKPASNKPPNEITSETPQGQLGFDFEGLEQAYPRPGPGYDYANWDPSRPPRVSNLPPNATPPAPYDRWGPNYDQRSIPGMGQDLEGGDQLSFLGVDPQWNNRPTRERPLPPPRNALEQLKREYANASGGRATRLRAALSSFAPSVTPPGDGGGDNLPPDSTGPSTGGDGGGTGGGGDGGGIPHPANPLGLGGDPETQDVMTMALLGEHGAPKWMRNLYFRQWAIHQGLDWASRSTNQLRSSLADPNSMSAKVAGAIPGLSAASASGMIAPIEGALEFASQHRGAILAGTLGYEAARHMWGRITNYQPLGQEFGYGPPALGTQNVFGFHNPLGYFGTAAQVGANQVMAEQALQGRIPGFGFGGGLSGQQSQDVMNHLAAQGFRMQPIGGGTIGGAVEIATSAIPGIGKPLAAGEAAFAHAMSQLPFGLGDISNSLFGGRGALQGDAATIGQNLYRPLMQQFPGLKAADLDQFTPALRYGGTSIQQLTDELKGLGAGAMATKETIGEFTASVGQAAQGFRGLGSTQQGGVATAMGFTQATGLDPQIASQAAQNPLMQSMALMQYGVLPSGLGDMASGAFTNSTLSSLQLLQGALSGLGRTRYQTVNGVRLPVEQGSQVVYDQIAHMTGMDPNVVKQMLQDAPAEHARAQAGSVLGDFTSNTGLAGLVQSAQAGRQGGKMSQADYTRLTQDWNKAAVPELHRAGISQKEITHLGHISGLRDRIQAANRDLQNAAKDDPLNQIKNKPASGQTVNVQLGLTPAAQKLVQQVGPSTSKVNANAGGPAINSIYNGTVGDVSPAVGGRFG